MSKKKSKSDKKYEEIKAYYKTKAKAKEQDMHMDLMAVRHEYVPHHLKYKFLTGLALFGSVYLTEKLIFGKKLPRIIRFTTSLAAVVAAPKVYDLVGKKVFNSDGEAPTQIEVVPESRLSHEAEVIEPAIGAPHTYAVDPDVPQKLVEEEPPVTTRTVVPEDVTTSHTSVTTPSDRTNSNKTEDTPAKSAAPMQNLENPDFPVSDPEATPPKDDEKNP